jgi:hypothetical protein
MGEMYPRRGAGGHASGRQDARGLRSRARFKGPELPERAGEPHVLRQPRQLRSTMQEEHPRRGSEMRIIAVFADPAEVR